MHRKCFIDPAGLSITTSFYGASHWHWNDCSLMSYCHKHVSLIRSICSQSLPSYVELSIVLTEMMVPLSRSANQVPSTTVRLQLFGRAASSTARVHVTAPAFGIQPQGLKGCITGCPEVLIMRISSPRVWAFHSFLWLPFFSNPCIRTSNKSGIPLRHTHTHREARLRRDRHLPELSPT